MGSGRRGVRSTVNYPDVPKLPAGLRVALVGTGPSGGYALRTLLDRTEAQVTVIDKLPTPGGLVRAGVAPDHPGTKGSCVASTSCTAIRA